MKNAVKKIFNLVGLDIRKLKRSEYHRRSKSKRSDKLRLYETATGKYFLPSDAYQDVIANSIIDNEVYDAEIVECAKKYIKKDTVVLDVGANYGQMSILFSEIAGKGGKVYSFEADDFIYEILTKNIEVNNRENIKPVFGAVHDREGETLFFPIQDFERFGTYGSYGIDYTNQKKGREVKTLTIDSLEIREKISFMKVDIQGGDLLALKGAVKTIQINKMPILFEFEYLFQDDLNLKFQDYVDFVDQIDYQFARVVNGQNYLILPK